MNQSKIDPGTEARGFNYPRAFQRDEVCVDFYKRTSLLHEGSDPAMQTMLRIRHVLSQILLDISVAVAYHVVYHATY